MTQENLELCLRLNEIVQKAFSKLWEWVKEVVRRIKEVWDTVSFTLEKITKKSEESHKRNLDGSRNSRRKIAKTIKKCIRMEAKKAPNVTRPLSHARSSC